MVVTKKNFAPFGSAQKRFGKITVHPNLDPSGLYSVRDLGCDPCLYHPVPLHEVCQAKHKVKKDPWKCKSELEDWSKNLGYRNQNILEKRRWQASLLGPAWTTVPDPVKYEPACKNLNFGRTPRTKPSKNFIPGPGTYYKEVPFKAPYGPHSTRPTFLREEPCRFKDTSPKWSLAPNRYTIVDKDSIENKPKKIISKRGPYDLFTGNREQSSKNHFNTSLKCAAATWPLALPGSLEKYKKSHFGKLNKTDRNIPYKGRLGVSYLPSCSRSPTEPSAAQYNVDKPREFVQYKHGFNSSYDRPPGYKRVVVWPGVGRYTVQRSRPCGILGQGHKHVFLSKVGRTIGAVLPEKLNTF